MVSIAQALTEAERAEESTFEREAEIRLEEGRLEQLRQPGTIETQVSLARGVGLGGVGQELTRRRKVIRKQKERGVERTTQAREELAAFREQISERRQEIKRAQARENEAAKFNRDLRLAQKFADRGRIPIGESRRVRELFSQIRAGQRLTERFVGQVKTAKEEGLTPIFVSGELRGFESERAVSSIELKDLPSFQPTALQPLEEAGLIEVERGAAISDTQFQTLQPPQFTSLPSLVPEQESATGKIPKFFSRLVTESRIDEPRFIGVPRGQEAPLPVGLLAIAGQETVEVLRSPGFGVGGRRPQTAFDLFTPDTTEREQRVREVATGFGGRTISLGVPRTAEQVAAQALFFQLPSPIQKGLGLGFGGERIVRGETLEEKTLGGAIAGVSALSSAQSASSLLTKISPKGLKVGELPSGGLGIKGVPSLEKTPIRLDVISPRGRFDILTETSKTFDIPFAKPVSKITLSLEEQAKIAGTTTTAISAQSNLLGRVFGRQKVLDRTFFADPFGRLRISRFGEGREATFGELLSGEARLAKGRQQALVFEDVRVEPFPKGLSDVQAKLLSGKPLTASEQARLLKFQQTPSGQFKPIGKVTKEPEIVLESGEIIKRGEGLGVTSIRGRRTDIFRAEIGKPSKELGLSIEQAKKGELGARGLRNLEKQLAKETGLSLSRTDSRPFFPLSKLSKPSGAFSFKSLGLSLPSRSKARGRPISSIFPVSKARGRDVFSPKPPRILSRSASRKPTRRGVPSFGFPTFTGLSPPTKSGDFQTILPPERRTRGRRVKRKVTRKRRRFRSPVSVSFTAQALDLRGRFPTPRIRGLGLTPGQIRVIPTRRRRR